MPYNTEYSQNIANQLQSLYKKSIDYKNATDNNTRDNDVMSPLEGLAMRDSKIFGGSGTAAATLQDLGFEQMNGISGSGLKKRRAPRAKPEVVALPTADTNQNISVTAGGVSGGGVSAGGVSGGGVSGGSDERAIGGGVSGGAEKKKRAPRKKKEPPIEPTTEAPEEAVEKKRAPRKLKEPPIEPTTEAPVEGGAKPKRSNQRAAIVSNIMKEKGMKMVEASKYVKEHGLYKFKTGGPSPAPHGGALMTLASLDKMEGNQGPTPFTSGGESVGGYI